METYYIGIPQQTKKAPATSNIVTANALSRFEAVPILWCFLRRTDIQMHT